MGADWGKVDTAAGDGTAPVLSVEEFRARYTDAHREALQEMVESHRAAVRAAHLRIGCSPDEASREADAEMTVHRDVQRLIFHLHPPGFAW